MKLLYIAISLSVLLMSCNHSKDEIDIRNLIDQIYDTQNPFRNTELQVGNFSKNLQTLVTEAKLIENKSIESIPEQERSNIKPYIIDGEIFASLYEGYTAYTIQELVIQENSATMKVEFVFDLYGTNEIWTDKIILVNEKSWKLDNVIYGNTGNSSADLKEVLSKFIQGIPD